MINAESKKATGQVTHLNSTSFLPISILLQYRAKPPSPELITPSATSQLSPYSTEAFLHSHPSPGPRRPPHHPSLLNEKCPPPRTCIFPTPCSCLSPGFSYSGNSPLSLIHHLATSPYLHMLWSETFSFVLPILRIIPIFLSSTNFFLPNRLTHMDVHTACSAPKEDSLFLPALVQSCSECGPCPAALSITWVGVRHAESQAPPHTYRLGNAGDGVHPASQVILAHANICEPLPLG